MCLWKDGLSHPSGTSGGSNQRQTTSAGPVFNNSRTLGPGGKTQEAHSTPGGRPTTLRGRALLGGKPPEMESGTCRSHRLRYPPTPQRD